MPRATLARSLVCAWLSLMLPGASTAQPAVDAAAAERLTREISAASAAMFDAFNRCDLEAFRSHLTQGIEFYHDRSGLETSTDAVVASVKANICGKVRRDLVAGSVEVHPIPNFGAIEIGTHQFYETARGAEAGPVGIAKYVHVWQQTPAGWKLARVISYGHEPAN